MLDINLRAADLTNADLRGARLKVADMTRAKFDGAKMDEGLRTSILRKS